MAARGRGLGFTAGLAVAVVAVQLAASAAHKVFYLTQLTMAAYAMLVVLGLALLMGYAGQASMGQAGFFAIGGYVAAFLTTFDLAPRARHGAGRAARAGAPAADAARTAAAAPSPTSTPGPPRSSRSGSRPRSPGWSPARSSACAATTWRWRRSASGSSSTGSSSAARTSAPPTASPTCRRSRCCPASRSPGAPRPGSSNYYAAWGLVLLTLWMLTNLIESRVGRALRAIHGSENAAAAVGIPIAALQDAGLRARGGARGARRRAAHALQRRDRPLGGLGHEVGALRRDRRRRRHGQPARRARRWARC